MFPVCKMRFSRENHLRSFARDENGAILIFSLFLFVIMLFVAGISVDVMLNERERVRAQTTLDTAVISATAIDQERNPDEVVRDYMEFAGFERDRVEISPIVQTNRGSTITGRSVAAGYPIETNTIFSGLLGIESLSSTTGGRAEEGTAELEIALVLDISASMGENGKLDELKRAAREFVTTVLTNNDSSKVSISIVPYNHQVYMSDIMQDTLPRTAGSDEHSRCAFFGSAGNFSQRSIFPNGNGLPRSAIFTNDRYIDYEKDGVRNEPYAAPHDWSRWCNNEAPRVELYSNNEADLHDYIDDLEALEGTAIDYGMKWGVAVLDPSMRPTVAAMVANGDRTNDADGHPFDYGQDDVLKFIILMSDGQNDEQYNLRANFRSGPSPVYHSEFLANGVETDGYLVPRLDSYNNIVSWYVPGDPLDATDDYELTPLTVPSDIENRSYQDLYKRFTVMDVARYFFDEDEDRQAFVDHADAAYLVTGQQGMDNRTQRACNAAKADQRITVFSVSFDAPEGGQNLLQDCATTTGHYFDAGSFGGTTSVTEAFATIAAQLTVLRIVN